MINPIQRSGFNFEQQRTIKNITKQREKMKTEKGIVLEIQTAAVEDLSASQKVETLKKLIKKDEYPLEPQKVAEKLINFLTDVG